MSASTTATLRHDWSLAEVKALFVQPFNDLLFQAQTVHRAHFDANRVQVSTLLSIKTGACPEDCKYCPQSPEHKREVYIWLKNVQSCLVCDEATESADCVCNVCETELPWLMEQCTQ
jgi:biotin synthase-like enzyme